MNLDHRAYQGGIAAEVTDPPSRHREGFGKSANDDGAFPHPRQRSNAGMRTAEGQLGIDRCGDRRRAYRDRSARL